MSGAVGSNPTFTVSGLPRASFVFRSLRSMKSTVPLPRKSSCSSRVMAAHCSRGLAVSRLRGLAVGVAGVLGYWVTEQLSNRATQQPRDPEKEFDTSHPRLYTSPPDEHRLRSHPAPPPSPRDVGVPHAPRSDKGRSAKTTQPTDLNLFSDTGKRFLTLWPQIRDTRQAFTHCWSK